MSPSLIAPEPAKLSRSSTPQSYVSGGLESRSPVPSSGSGVFENETQRKKSHPHSDKGYGSTTSVSSGSSGDSKWYLTLARSHPNLVPNVLNLHYPQFLRPLNGALSFWYEIYMLCSLLVSLCSSLVVFLASSGLGKILRNSQNIYAYYM